MRETMVLNGVWDFGYFGESVPEISAELKNVMVVPGCFDLVSPWCGERGYALYRRTVRIGGMVELFIDGLGVAAEIFWDGKPVGKAEIAYLPEKLRFDAGEEKEHILAVRFDNHHNEHMQPQFDFFAYGGFYGDVTISRIPEFPVYDVRISTEDYRTGTIRIRANADGFSGKAELIFDNGFTAQGDFVDGKLDCTLTLNGFRLWELDDPQMHKVIIRTTADEIEESFGIREFTSRGKELILNGKAVKLIGVNRHESHPTFGAAVPPQMMVADLGMLKEAGYNFIRGSHYPQRREFLELCDRMGMLVWEETLGWDFRTCHFADPAALGSQLKQAEKMTLASFNHPCVVIRGFLNETASDEPANKAGIQALYNQIRAVDEHVLISLASNKFPKDVCADIYDVIALNTYPGWYDSCNEKITTIDRVRPAYERLAGGLPQDKPFIIGETGCEAIYGFRDPLNTYWSEDYQAEMLLEAFRYVKESDCAGISLWMFCDTRSHVTGPHVYTRARGFNNKGIVDEYRRPKQAWIELRKFNKGQRD